MDRVTDTHVYFWGSPFSNWYNCKVKHEGETFHNSEQAFMWEKAMYFDDLEIADLILEASSPSVAKSLGREVSGFNAETWSNVSYEYMVDVCYEKFRQHPKLQILLLSTGDKVIVEASPHDKIWGVGLHWDDDKILDEANWNGQNLLGKALMDVREKLKK